MAKDDPRVAAVLIADEKRRKALVERDIATLRKVLSPDLTYTHSIGTTDDYDRFISMMEIGDMRFLKFDVRDVYVRLYGSVAVLTGVNEAIGQITGRDLMNITAKVLQVWVESEGEWKLVATQATSVPKPV